MEVRLNKKYRLIWDKTSKQIIGDHITEYTDGSITVFDDSDKDYLESDSLQEIEDKINQEQLKVMDDVQGIL